MAATQRRVRGRDALAPGGGVGDGGLDQRDGLGRLAAKAASIIAVNGAERVPVAAQTASDSVIRAAAAR